MKRLVLLTLITLSSVFAQTPTTKYTIPAGLVTGWLFPPAQMIPYYCDSTKLTVYNQITSSTLSTKFTVTFPNGFIAGTSVPFVLSVADISGDKKNDIEAMSGNNYLFIDGATGDILYEISADEVYYYPEDVDGDGQNEIVTKSGSNWVIYSTQGVATGVTQRQGQPTNFSLEQNYPNPFNPTTTIEYSLPSRESVVLKIYDSTGREVRTLVDNTQSAGAHSVTLNGTGLASGMYFYQLRAGGSVQAKKLVFIK